MARVNGDKYEELAAKFGVKKYPGIYVYLGGEPVAYDGGATADALLYYLRNATGREPGTPAKQLHGKAETLKWAFWRGNPGDVLLPTLVASFPEAAAEGHTDALATWTRLAYDLARQGFRVAQVRDAEAITALRLDPARPALAMVREFDEGKVVYDGPFTEPALSDFVTTHNVPMVAFVDHTTLRAHQRRKHWLVHVFVEPVGAEPRAKLGRYYQKRMLEVRGGRGVPWRRRGPALTSFAHPHALSTRRSPAVSSTPACCNAASSRSQSRTGASTTSGCVLSGSRTMTCRRWLWWTRRATRAGRTASWRATLRRKRSST